jgi:hypothetical protein
MGDGSVTADTVTDIGTGIHSLADLHERHIRQDTLSVARRAARGALLGALAGAPIALGLVSVGVGVLALAPTAVFPPIETLSLALVSIWSLLALYATALLSVWM